MAEVTRARFSRIHNIIAEKDGSGDDYEWEDKYEMLECRGCLGIKMRNRFGTPGQKLDEIYYPPATARRKPEWMDLLCELGIEDSKIPTNIFELINEVYVALQNGSRRLAAMGIRSIIENVMVERIGDKHTFKANIDSFQHEGYLSVRQAHTLESILEAGHATIHRGIHPTDKDISTLLDITESMIETVYLHEDKVRELEKRIPRRIPTKRPSSE